jgi:hypothetical protein
MVWTPPRTWATGELVTASIANTHWRDEFLALSQARGFLFVIGDVNGGVINTGLKGFFMVPYTCDVTGWTLLGDAVGSIVIDVWRDTYANFPPTVADTITGSEKPTLTAQIKNQDLSLGTWNRTVNAGDVLAFNVDSAATVKQASLILSAELS